MKYSWKRRIFSFIIACGCGAAFAGSAFLTVHAEVIDYQAQAEANKLITIESNQVDNWPQGPVVSAKSAILMDADTGAVLYAKNIHEALYPASTTKILTAYIARQKSQLDEVVEYSSEAVNSIDWRSDSNIGIKAGEAITMEQSLYGLLVGSGNECGNAIGEHISGSMEAFVELMNQTAKELGCTDSNFVTTNGKHDDNHYTSAHDLALIGRKFFADEVLCKMSNTRSYTIPACATVSQELVPNSKNQLLPGKKYAYEYLVGSKTGYTSQARSNLVSCAEKNGLKLICVVMADESPQQFQDTISLFEYGFSNFSSVSAADNDTDYAISSGGLFSANGPAGDGSQILSIDAGAKLTLPATITFQDVTSELSYDDAADGQAAVIHYSYNGQALGSAPILFGKHVASFDFNAQPLTEEELASMAATENAAPDGTDGQPVKTAAENGEKTSAAAGTVVFLNIKNVLIVVGIIAAALIGIAVVRAAFTSRARSRRRRDIMKRRRDSRKDEIIDFDKYTDTL
ncbi:MAG: D-alanyl-D-alanine carboxypeptidase family protein [Eubacteriales bacterium]|nr:D-alanyl-D-alanine carboxypeptidase family protein [Eubacteriales bacterium]